MDVNPPGSSVRGIFFLIYVFYWCIIDLQCFRHTARWFNYICTYTDSTNIIFRLSPIIGYYKILTVVPTAIQLTFAAFCVSIFKIQPPPGNLAKISCAGKVPELSPCLLVLSIHLEPFLRTLPFKHNYNLSGHPTMTTCLFLHSYNWKILFPSNARTNWRLLLMRPKDLSLMNGVMLMWQSTDLPKYGWQ